MKKTPAPVLIVIGSIALLIALLLLFMLRHPSHALDIRYFYCLSCGDFRRTCVESRYGFAMNKQDDVFPKALSDRLAEATGTDCEHDWRQVYHYISLPRGYERSGSRPLVDVIDAMVDSDEDAIAIVRFAETSGRSPRHVCQTLLGYMTREGAGGDLLDGLSDRDKRDGKPFDAWLDENYDRIAEALKGGGFPPPPENGEDPAEDDAVQF